MCYYPAPYKPHQHSVNFYLLCSAGGFEYPLAGYHDGGSFARRQLLLFSRSPEGSQPPPFYPSETSTRMTHQSFIKGFMVLRTEASDFS